jgi:Na+/H+ antiporter NhaC
MKNIPKSPYPLSPNEKTVPSLFFYFIFYYYFFFNSNYIHRARAAERQECSDDVGNQIFFIISLICYITISKFVKVNYNKILKFLGKKKKNRSIFFKKNK